MTGPCQLGTFRSTRPQARPGPTRETEPAMTLIPIAALGGGTRDIASETLDIFAAGLEGSLLYPGDAGFAESTLI